MRNIEQQRFHNNGSHSIEIIVSIMAGIGGAARYFNDMFKNNTPFSGIKLALKVITCIFVGFTVWSAAIGAGFNGYIAIAASNLGAWLGVEALSFGWELIQNYLRNKYQ